tara:strand:+ start:1605 stop:2276 length:672 start_codon:yes stop_codon:yes gene_type:complete
MAKSIIVAIDEHENVSFDKVLGALDPNLCMVKIGSVSFNALGHNIIYSAAKKGFDIFLDLKLHDIPNTVKKSIEGLASLPINMLTVHTSGGKLMMESAMEALKGTDIKVFGVTTLTSLSDMDTNKIYRRTAADQVNAMLDIAEDAKIDGVVCSPHELNLVTARGSLLSITPGIRLLDSNDDQTRVMTPKEAIDLGSNYLVIGRPITHAENISEALSAIYQSIN